MAYIYGSMGDKEKTVTMMLECAAIYKEIGEDMRYGSCIVDLCATYLELDQPDSVLARLPEIQEIFKGRYQVGEAAVFYNMGEAYKQKKDYERALANYDQTSELMKDLNWPRFLMEIEISRSECYTALGDYEMAYRKILDAEEISKQTSNAEGTMNILQYKMYAAHDVGKHDESYEAALDYIDLKDSLRSIARDQEVAAMQEELEAEKREHEIDILEREAEIDEQKKTGLFIIVVLVTFGAILVVNREIQRRKKAKQLHDTEIELRETNEARLKEELAFKKRELASKALQIAQKNEVLESLREEVQNISLNSQADRSVKEVLNTLKIERSIDGNWEEFTRQFQEINPDFYQRLNDKAEGMTKNDLRLAALLKMNLSSKEIASVLNITMEGVKKARQRFRKKLELSSEDSLEKFVIEL